MKHLIFAVATAAAVIGFAEEAKKPATTVPAPAPTQSSKAGRVVKPGSQKGVFSIINTQSTLPQAEIAKAAKDIEQELLIKVEITTAAPGDPAALVKAAKGELGLVVMDDDKTPAMLLAPEDGWGVVNVRKLDQFPTPEAKAKSYHDRCRREILRCFSGVAGGLCSTYPGNIMDAARISDIDILAEGIPADKIQSAQKYLKAHGYAPLIRAPYGKACREGWAPPPTNDAQKVIWDRVHELPSNPIKIKFDPKRDK